MSKKTVLRLICWLLVLAMTLSSVPAQGLAEGIGELTSAEVPSDPEKEAPPDPSETDPDVQDPGKDEAEVSAVESQGLRAVQLYGPAAMKASEAEKIAREKTDLNASEIDSLKKRKRAIPISLSRIVTAILWQRLSSCVFGTISRSERPKNARYIAISTDRRSDTSFIRKKANAVGQTKICTTAWIS